MGWNGSDMQKDGAKKVSPKGPARRASSLGGPLLVGLAVAALVALVVWFVTGGSDDRAPTPSAPSAPAKIVDAPPAPKKSSPKKTPPPAPKKLAAVEPAAPELPPGARTNVLGQIVVGESVVHSNAFRSGAEQVMAWIFTTEVGDMPPVMPKVTIRDEQQLLDMFTKPLEAAEGDSERTKLAKENVEFAKKELKEYLKEGGDIQDFLSFYREQLVSAYHERMDARKMAMDMYRNGENKEVCDAFVAKINEKLAAKGIKAVDIPEAFIQKCAQED